MLNSNSSQHGPQPENSSLLVPRPQALHSTGGTIVPYTCSDRPTRPHMHVIERCRIVRNTQAHSPLSWFSSCSPTPSTMVSCAFVRFNPFFTVLHHPWSTAVLSCVVLPTWVARSGGSGEGGSFPFSQSRGIGVVFLVWHPLHFCAVLPDGWWQKDGRCIALAHGSGGLYVRVIEHV